MLLISVLFVIHAKNRVLCYYSPMNEIPEFPKQIDVELSHFDIISDALDAQGIRSAEFSVYYLISWFYTRPARISRIGNRLLIDVEARDGRHIFLGPFGKGNLKHALDVFLDNVEQFGVQRVLRFAPAAMANEIRAEHCVIREEKHRDYFDYIYLRDDLANLPGRKFQKRRNQVNKVKRAINPEVKIIEPGDSDELLCCLNRWYDEYGDGDPSLDMEKDSVKRIIKELPKLNGIGIKIEVADELCAMSWAVPLNSDTWLVPIEKASKRMHGMYQYLNWALANRVPESVKYLNREADLGIEGLRIAKTRYNPVFLEEKFTLWL